MKKHLFLKSLLIAIGLLMTCINTAWADVYYVYGVDDSWVENSTHQMVSSGITNWVYKDVTSASQWTSGGFKVYNKTSNTWYGKDSDKNDVTVGSEYTPTTTGDNAYCDFKAGSLVYYFFFNTSTKKLMIRPKYYLAGTCGASNQNWGKTQNAPTYDATNGYFKWNTCTLTAGTDYKFKLCTYNTWDYYNYQDGSSATVSNGTKQTTDKDNNIIFRASHGGTAVVTFNPITNALVVNCPYQVSYAAGTGATGTISSGAVTTYGTSFTLTTSKFTRTGYTQDGWATSDGGDKVYDMGGTYTGYVDITLYPHWKANTYTVTFDKQSGTGGSNGVTATYDAAMPAMTKPSREGYSFQGYYASAGGSGTQYYYYNGSSAHNWDQASATTLYANWALKRTITMYYAVPADVVACNTVKCYVDYGYDQSAQDLTMTKTAYTYGGKLIYSIEVTANYDGFDAIYFKPKGTSGEGSAEQTGCNTRTSASSLSGQMYVHGSGWTSYSKDASYTVYFVNASSWTIPKAYAWNSDCDKNAAYATSGAMTNTGKTYNGKAIWSITFDKRYDKIIFNDNGSESSKTGNLTLGSTNAGKLFTFATSTTSWIPNTYDVAVTLHDNNGGSHNGSANVHYLYGTSFVSKTAPTRTGYTVEGYYKEVGTTTKIATAAGALQATTTYTNGSSQWSTGAQTLYTKWTANTWYVRFNRNGGTTGSDMANESFTYDAAAKALTTNTFTRSGYAFQGWATTPERANAGTVDYADETTVRNLTSDPGGIFDLYAVWTANNYTVSFNVNGGTADTPDSKSVTFGSAYGTLPGGMTHASKTFIGWYDDSRDGEGNHITAETTVSTASNHTLYAHYETVYAVDVDFKCGSAKVYPSTRVNASATSLAPTIIAPEVFGYSFTGWTGSNVTFADASNDTTTVKATAATTITANYAVVPTVYFKNNLGWDSVFVTFNCGWATVDGKQVPSNKTKPYYKMTQIGSTDIYYCEIPSTYTASDYASWAWNIAFDNKNYGGHATSDHIGTWDFYGGEFTGRGDFDPKATLFIPYNGDTETRNTGKFYQSGCWMKYNSTESGYEVKMNTWVKGEHADTCTVALTAANAGGYEFSAKIHMERANYSYGFKLYKPYKKNKTDLWYTNTGEITATTETLPWNFWSGSSITANSDRCGLHTEALGDYTITVSLATGKPMVDVEYPASVGDWRLAYNDLVAWSGDAHDASWYLYSRVIKAKADAIDTVSFYVSKAAGANAHVELQKCTAIDAGTGVETWTKQGSNLDLSGITGTGIYNFKVTQNGSKVATAAYDTAYVGNFYIRTDASDGGWNNYISSGKNQMTYSEYAKDNSGYTHYFTRYVTSGSNIKFCIANDYSECLTEYCISDDYTNEYIEANGNVRFMWDHRTNAVSRAYISGSSIVSDRFLVLEGDALLFNESGQALTTAGGGKVSGLNDNEINFRDDQNWIYEATVKAKPGARIKLTAKYNNKIQYFYGNSGSTAADSVLLLGGSDDNQYKIRVVYDFKTNRLIKAFIPDGNIGTELAIDADMMIIREHQEDAQQVTFTEGGSLSKVNTVYGAMKFNKYTVNGKEKTGGHGATGASRYERDLFYISFPFDVKLSDAFGFGTYGKHWIIEYYDGVGRAKNGFWADSPSNWKFVMPAQRNNGFVMKAFEGYILALELDEMAESSSVWDNGVEDVYIYFPSADSVKNIQATNRLIEINQDDYECTIGPRFGGGDDRRVKDSYWHCIGVPSFANYSSAIAPTSGGTTIDWRSTSMPYLYEWNSSNNTLAITSSATFSFKATWSYLVQYAGESIYWSAVNATPASIVARERTAPENAEFRIELQKAGEKADQAYVRLTQDENVTTGYDFNYDLSKEFNKNKANIYTMVTTIMEDGPSITEVAGNVQPMTEQTTVIPVGVKIATTGDYTFAIPDGTDGIGVTLIDNETGIRTSLSAINYTINLSAGTYDNRFVLEISPIKPVATGVEVLNGENGENGVRKVMIDGLLYIVKNGKMYDARGAVVK